MSKSLNELFGLLANAGAPRSAEEYRASLKGIREKIANGGEGSGVRGHQSIKTNKPKNVELIDSKKKIKKPWFPELDITDQVPGVFKNSSTCLQANENDKAKCIADNLGVDGQGKTPLGKIFSKPKITNGGPGSGRKPLAYGISEGDRVKFTTQTGRDTQGTAHHYADDLFHVRLDGGQEHIVYKTKVSKLLNGGVGSGQAGHRTDHPPVTNVQGGWMYHPESETYSAESSELNHSNRQDPWGRPLLMRYMKQHADDDNDVTHWSGTIQAPPASMGTLGKAAKIKIFND